jgi:hypothetical protein
VLRIVRVVTDARQDAILVVRHSALHDSVQEKRNGTLCYSFFPENAKLMGIKIGWERRTLERQVETTIVLSFRGGIEVVGKATGFHQSLPRGVQPSRG